MALIIQANAKINLDFEILGKLPNGFHEIESTFQSIDLSDYLIFEKDKKTTFTGAIICPESQNIILKAKQILERKINKRLPVKIHLQKSIPIAAGLGGGSADAAATLFALNKLYNLKLIIKELTDMGVKSGADVPFFFYGGTCKVGGIGEIVSPIKKKVSKLFVLFHPHQKKETKKLYELYDKTGKDFLTLTKELCPDIKKIETIFSKFKLKLKLSGSGPTVFGEINNYSLAKKIIEACPDFNGDVFICHPQNKALNIL